MPCQSSGKRLLTRNCVFISAPLWGQGCVCGSFCSPTCISLLRCIGRSIAELSSLLLNIQKAQYLLFLCISHEFSRIVAGCNPVRADLLITIKSLSGALYFDLSLHNIKGLYIKGGAKMIRLIGRDQRKTGNSSGRGFIGVFRQKR